MVNKDGVLKVCKNCVHYQERDYSVQNDFNTCKLDVERQKRMIEASRKMDPVSGKMVATRHYVVHGSMCDYQRSAGWIDARLRGFCGKEGRFFVHKKPEPIPYSGDPENDPNPPDFNEYV
jgi:hypothetical protein